MGHPYKEQAESSRKAKSSSMGRANNLDIPIMRAVGENKRGGLHESTSTAQLKSQSGAPGMKRGGHVKHSKSKMAVIAPAAPPPSADPAALAAAGAGSSPVPAPMGPPGQPPMKRGGAVKKGAYPLHGGGKSGIGRLEKNHAGKPPFKAIKKGD